MEEELAKLNLHRADLLAQVAELQQERAALLGAPDVMPASTSQTLINNRSAQEAKIALFRSLFRAREDIYPRRFESLKAGKKGYQPVRRNEWAIGICPKPKGHCEDCPHREFLPVTDTVIKNHLLGMDPTDRSGRDFTIGIYPMLPDETCWFLAADFDKAAWQEDVKAVMGTCKLLEVPAALERSRSGNGGHAALATRRLVMRW
jgi:hypothetical protein